jgi:SET domain-containing protein
MLKGQQRFVVKRTNTGLGLFATESIPAGKRLIEYTGRILPNEVVDKMRGKYFFGINSKWSIDGSARSNIARYFNHSCKPNAEAFVSGKRVWVWSKKNIKAGQEITINYGKEYFDQFIKPKGCKCAQCINGQEKKQPPKTST